MAKLKTYDAAGTLRLRKKPGEFGGGLGRYEVVSEHEGRDVVTCYVNDGPGVKCDPFVNKFVYMRGCIISDGKIPLIRATYCGNDAASRDLTPDCD